LASGYGICTLFLCRHEIETLKGNVRALLGVRVNG